MSKLKHRTIYIIRNQAEYNFLIPLLKPYMNEYEKTYIANRNYDEWRRDILGNDLPVDTPAIRVTDFNNWGKCTLDWYKEQPEFNNYNYVEVADLIKNEKEKQDKMEEEIKICAICGREIAEEDDYMTNRHGEHLCESCQNDGYVECADCGDFIDDPVTIDDYYYVCECCANDNYYYCECCEGYYTRDNVRETYDGHYVCDDCYDRRDYYRCADCGRVMHYDDAYYNDHDEEYYCPNCRDNHSDYEGEITDYHDHHGDTIYYYNDDGVTTNESEFQGGYGFELEVDDGDNRGECSTELYDLLGRHFVYETDGSLSDDGFEIISRPHTRKAMEQLPFVEMIRILRSYGFKSHNSYHCGLHVHVSRKLFGETEVERTENIAKMILFYEIFWDDLVKVSRRKSFGYCEKLSSYNNGAIEEEQAKKIAKGEDRIAGDRYKAINLMNNDTVEFRLMRGTLKLSTLLATLDFTMRLVENCKTIPMDKVGRKDLWLQGLKQETIEYLKERRAFGYEQDDETEDI